jgi:DNA-binding NtrC family response regulator
VTHASARQVKHLSLPAGVTRRGSQTWGAKLATCAEAATPVTRRVLVVCRDLEISRVVEQATQAWMFETVVCTSVQESRDCLERKDFALIFCEEQCEGGTYSDLLPVARSRKVPVVVMMSDVDQSCVFQNAMAAGAFGVLASPGSRQDVQWMVIRATQKEAGFRPSL